MLGASFSHYRITGKLGEGGMGVVYIAEDTALGREVAIKFPHPEEGPGGQLLREARAASNLSHPHIASIHDCGEHDGQPYVVMELVRGRSLDDLLREGALPVSDSIGIAAQVAEALAEAHRHGIVHRDIKPSNVRIDERGNVKVIDFGLARRVAGVAASASSASASPTISMEGQLAGTPAYMSPEQARGHAGDARSDLFSLGAMLYECLAGRRPFGGTSMIEALAQVLEVSPAPPSKVNPHVPEWLDGIVMKALAKAPGARYQSAGEMLADLQARPVARHRPAAGLRLSPLRVVSVLLVLAAVVAAAWLWASRSGSLRQPAPEALRWYQEGVNALRDGTYYKASQALERATAADPQFALAQARLAEAWNELDYSDRAREAMLRATAPGMPAGIAKTDRLQLAAIHAVLTNDYRTAVARYRDLARSAPEPDLASVLVDLGRALERADKSGEAIANYNEAVRRRPDLAAAFLRLGTLLRRQRRYPEAEKALGQAEALYRSLSNLEGVTETVYQRGIMLNQMGRLSDAQALLEEGLGLAKAGGNNYHRIEMLMQLSSACYAQGQVVQAQQHASDALELARTQGFEDLSARALMEMGGNAHVRGDLVKAVNYYQQALESAWRFKGRRSEMRALVSLASAHTSLGDPDAAVRELQQPLAWYERNGYRKDAGVARILVARAKRMREDYEGAAAALERQLEEARRDRDDEQAMVALDELAQNLTEQERYAESLSRSSESHGIARARGNKVTLRWAGAQMADALWRLGRYTEARQELAASAKIATETQDKGLLAWIDRIRAAMALTEGRFADAEAAARRAEAGELDKRDAADAVRIAALAALGAGHKAEARRLIDRAASLAGPRETSWSRSERLIALAAVLLESGDAAGSLDAAREARETAARYGRRDSEWRALAVTVRAASALRDQQAARAAAKEAAEAQKRLWEILGPDQRSFASRPDIRDELRRLEPAAP